MLPRKFACLLLLVAAPRLANGFQSQQHPTGLPYTRDPANLPNALSNMDKEKYKGLDVELIVQMKATQAIPALERLFRNAQDVESKSQIAYGLVKLQVPDDSYWTFLAARAAEAINRAVPDPLSYDSRGTVLFDRPSKAFATWAKRKHLDPAVAFDQIVSRDAGVILYLASSGDSRAIPLLRKALTHPYCAVEAMAAEGLADLADTASIPLIIKATARGKAKEDCARAIAESLIYFDDRAAQRAVDLYLPRETAKIGRESRAKGRRPFD